jgi:hypothetical protein
MNDNKTIQIRRLPQRPANGLLAWQATIGFITSEISPDAALMMRVQPREDKLGWSASVAWTGLPAQSSEGESLAQVLRELWVKLEQVHTIFTTVEDRVRQPAHYQDHQWLDADTSRALDSLIDLTGAVFHHQWSLLFVYQSVDSPSQRVKARLLAKEDTVQISGQGPTLREACRDLYRHAAPNYFASSGRTVDDSLIG